MKGLLRKWAWWIILRTNESDIPHTVYRHSCGSESVVPLGKYFLNWKEPAFECLGCGCITNQNIEARLVNPNDKIIRYQVAKGMTILHPQY